MRLQVSISADPSCMVRQFRDFNVALLADDVPELVENTNFEEASKE